MNDEKIRELLERLGRALSNGDLKQASSCWGFPALVFFGKDATAVGDASEIERLFGQASEQYRKQGIVSTKPELERIDNLNDQLAAVDVRWPSFDASGAEKSSERSHYLVQFGDDRDARIRVALTRT